MRPRNYNIKKSVKLYWLAVLVAQREIKALKKNAYHYQVSIHWKPETVFDPIDPPRNPKETTNNKDKPKLTTYDTRKREI